jgi:regulator of replication initiation timing
MEVIKVQALTENEEYLNLLKEKDLIIAKFKDKITRLEKNILLQNQQISTLRTLLDKTMKDLDLLTHEYVMARRRISMLQPAAAEKICVNCKKAYKEEENFNWSCKTHLSEFSGNAWWCCGKSEKDDEGCSVTRHISKDDLDNEKQIKNTSKAICSVTII